MSEVRFNSGGRLGPVGSIIMLVLSLILIYVLVKGIFTILFWLSPILLIAGILIDVKGASTFGKWVLQAFKKNPLIPIGIVLLSALWFPVVPGILAALTGGFLISRSLIKKKIESTFGPIAVEKEQETFTDYEEVTEEDDDVLELPELDLPKQGEEGNEYENMF